MKIALFEDLRRVHDLRGGWDVVLFTGDMVFSGKVEEYAELDTRLSELWVMFGELGCAPALYVVPGNHDLTRSTRPSAAERMLLQPGQYTPVRDELFRGNEPDGRKAIDDAFAHYSEWAESCPHMDNSISPGCLPGDFVATVCKDGIRLGLAGLNTAFLQLAGDETVRQLTGAAQEGHLDLHPQQLLDACENDPERWAVGHHACLLMTHHPPSWLSDAGTEALHADIGPAGRFAVQLCGHVHATLRREVSEGGADVRRLWQNRSMFGLERCDNGATERVHGYAVGSIEFSENTGSLRFWPRKAQKISGRWECVPDHDAGRLDTGDHTKPVPFDLLAPVAADGSTEDNSERTSRMVAPARRATQAVAPDRDESGVADAAGLRDVPTFTLRTLARFLPDVPQVAAIRMAAHAPAEEDIAVRPVRLAGRYSLPLHEVVRLAGKAPADGAMETEAQIVQSFIPFPKITRHLDDWLGGGHDLLFLAPPLCGKTSLLTFLAHEASRRGDLTPIRLQATRELREHEVDDAAAQCAARLRQLLSETPNARPVLVIDNVHLPHVYAIACELMGREDRPWRIWAAARAREFGDRCVDRNASAWREAECVTEACSLATAEDWEFIGDDVIAPILTARGAADQIPAVRDALGDKGNGPMWAVAETWRTVVAGMPPVDRGYDWLIRRVPVEDDSVTDSLRPKTIAGHDALAIMAILPRPSERLLVHVLAHAGGYDGNVAGQAVSSLRAQQTLHADPAYPERLNTPDVARDIAAEPANQTPGLSEAVPKAVASFLDSVSAEAESVETGDLALMWGAMARACEQGEEDLRVRCGTRSVEHARVAGDDATLAVALYNLAQSLRHGPEPDAEAALKCYDEALDLWGASEHPHVRAAILAGWSECRVEVACPDWDGAIAALREAEGLCRPEDAEFRVYILAQLGAMHHRRPEADSAACVEAWQQALAAATSIEPPARAQVLWQLASRVESTDPVAWDVLIKARQAVADLTEDADPKDRATVLTALGHALIGGDDPSHTEAAISALRQALALLPMDADPGVRGIILSGLVAALTGQSPWDWAAVAEHSRELLALPVTPDIEDWQTLARRVLVIVVRYQPSYTREVRQEALGLHRALVAELEDISMSLGLVMALDAAGETEEADARATRLAEADLGEGVDDAARVEAVQARRAAYLALRAGDAVDALLLTADHLSGPDACRTALLRAVALCAQGETESATEEVRRADGKWEDIAWLRVIAFGYFRRYAPDHIEPFFTMLSAAYGEEVGVTLD